MKKICKMIIKLIGKTTKIIEVNTTIKIRKITIIKIRNNNIKNTMMIDTTAEEILIEAIIIEKANIKIKDRTILIVGDMTIITKIVSMMEIVITIEIDKEINIIKREEMDMRIRKTTINKGTIITIEILSRETSQAEVMIKGIITIEMDKGTIIITKVMRREEIGTIEIMEVMETSQGIGIMIDTMIAERIEIDPTMETLATKTISIMTIEMVRKDQDATIMTTITDITEIKTTTIGKAHIINPNGKIKTTTLTAMMISKRIKQRTTTILINQTQTLLISITDNFT